MEKHLSTVADLEIESFIKDEIKIVVKEQLSIARQYIKPISQESCHNSSKDKALPKELADAKHMQYTAFVYVA